MPEVVEQQVAAFPLGGVLLPGQLLDLQVFEPRYRVMLFDLRDSEPQEFLVTMIERGSEVGGGDVRSPVGCMARVLTSDETGDGRTHLRVLGTERTEVLGWLDEDPYPRARVERPRDRDAIDERDRGAIDRQVQDALELAEVVLRAARQLGMTPIDPGPIEPGDPVAATWQLALRTPLGTLDRYRLLAEADPLRRARMLSTMLEESRQLLEALARPGDDAE